MFINGSLFNSESWQGISVNDIIPLEKPDQALLRTLVPSHAKVPLEFLHLETGKVPARFVVASRRVLYLQNILKRDKDELVMRVYTARKNDPLKGDFYQIVKDDLEDLDIKMNETEIKQMNRSKFKAIVKERIKKRALTYLKNQQIKNSKIDNIKYDSLEIQPYFKKKLCLILIVLQCFLASDPAQSGVSGMIFGECTPTSTVRCVGSIWTPCPRS